MQRRHLRWVKAPLRNAIECRDRHSNKGELIADLNEGAHQASAPSTDEPSLAGSSGAGWLAKSSARTAPSVTRSIKISLSRLGLRRPFTYRVTAAWVAPIMAANSVWVSSCSRR